MTNNLTEDIKKYVKTAHDIIYNNEQLKTSNSMSDIINLLFIRILNYKATIGKIDLFNKEYYTGTPVDQKRIDKTFANFDLLKMRRKCDISKEPLRNDDHDDCICDMGNILMVHPLTKKIFTSPDFIYMKQTTTIFKVLDCFVLKINPVDYIGTEDIIGNIYEYFMIEYAKDSKDLGQFFTPRNMMHLILNRYNEKLNSYFNILDVNENINIGDLCAGTGGWLALYSSMFKKYAKRINIHCNELEITTAKYALMNLLISNDDVPFNFNIINSLTNVDNKYLDIILSNPPFGASINYDDIKEQYNDIKNKYFEQYALPDGTYKDKKFITIFEGKCTNNITNKYICREEELREINLEKFEDIYELTTLKKSKNIDKSLWFLDLYINKLYDIGICIIVMPNGKLFYDKNFTIVRKRLLEKIDIIEIIKFESGTFSTTGVETCIVVFQHNDMINNVKNEILFSESDKECKNIKNIIKVKYSDIMKNSKYSLKMEDYIIDNDRIENKINKNIVMKKLGELCEILGGGKRKSNDGKKIGKYPLYYCSILGHLWIDEYDFDEENIILNSTNGSGKCSLYYCNGKFSTASSTIRIKSNSNICHIKYLYYYLNTNKKILEKLYNGINQKQISQENLKNLQIPLLPIEKQNFIVDYCSIIDENINCFKKLMDFYKNKLIKFITEEMTYKCENIVMKKLGELCEIKYGKRLTKNNMIFGEYPYYGGGGISSYCNQYNREGVTCKISRFGMSEKNCVMIISGKYYLGDAGLTINSKDEKIILNYYLWNYLLLQKKKIYKMGEGVAQKGIDIDDLKNLQIPLLSIEKQNEIVIICTNLDNKIINIKKNIIDMENEKNNFIMKNLSN